MINKVILVGNLGNDPEMKYAANGNAIANFSLATSERWRDKNTGEQQEKTEWHRVVFFGKVAEVIGEYLQKGRQVYVEGKLQTRKWTDKEGNDRYTTEVVGSTMQMLGQKGDSAPAPKQQGFRDNGVAKHQQRVEQPPAPDYNDDDIPF